MRNKLILLFAFLVLHVLTYAQMGNYNYQRKISDVNERWHRIELPDDLFMHSNKNLSDFRIYGVKTNKDTVEVPYILKVKIPQVIKEEVELSIINKSHNKDGYYYYTIQLKEDKLVNQLLLNFNQNNFDWSINLQGSHNQKEWFNIVDDYRIVSIKNDLTDYKFTKVSFTPCNYKFLRLRVPSKDNPQFANAKVIGTVSKVEPLKSFSLQDIKIRENKKNKYTEIMATLPNPVRASGIRIVVEDDFDYYRPISIKYLSDSVKTEKGWHYTYTSLTSGTLNSLEKNEFTFSGTTLHKLKIIVRNHDNQPLNIRNVEVSGYHHELLARFTETATYFLCYGNKMASKPQYDIATFNNRLPKTFSAVTLAEEVDNRKPQISNTESVFNRYWLWGVMLIIIALLMWSAIHMMKGAKE